jgi:hypothetical protein
MGEIPRFRMPGGLQIGWLISQEEFADEEACCSIFVGHFHYVLFRVVGADPSAG